MKRNVTLTNIAILLVYVASLSLVLITVLFFRTAPTAGPACEAGAETVHELEETLKALDRLTESMTELKRELMKYEDLSEQTGLSAGVLACIKTEAQNNGFDPSETLGRIQHESGFDPDCISVNRGSADIGLMQINSLTAPGLWAQVMDSPYDPGLEVAEGIFVDSRLFDPYINIRLGSWYYGQLLRQYQGSREHANTAYNRGEKGLERWMASRGTARSEYSERVMSLSIGWTSIDGL